MEVGLREPDFPHVELTNAGDFVVLVNDGRSLPLRLREDDVDEVLEIHAEVEIRARLKVGLEHLSLSTETLEMELAFGGIELNVISISFSITVLVGTTAIFLKLYCAISLLFLPTTISPDLSLSCYWTGGGRRERLEGALDSEKGRICEGRVGVRWMS